jgi:hypothetical protein
MSAQLGKCKCGCGGDAAWPSDYIPGHDLKHRNILIDRAGGADNLENLLSYSGPAKLDVIFFDDETREEIARIPIADCFYQVGQVQRNIGGHPCWLVTNVGAITVKHWDKIPPTLILPVYGHAI